MVAPAEILAGEESPGSKG